MSQLNKLLRAVLGAGILAGFLDALAAILQYLALGGRTPAIIFKYIASALMGPEAFAGGTGMVVLGVCIHFAFALFFAWVFFAIYPKVSTRNWPALLWAILYGLAVWAFMNLVALPLSRISAVKQSSEQLILSVLIIIFAVGLPIVLCTRAFYKARHN
ncbi:hypothetical protein C7T94_02415 [Pedobacter yulinensis]|uniref:DUF1440 domain-containing protein n=1 Tax=Pedobacter yulinensis TaxID=2126353 RepID=A0A2T3HRG8_9SPHI|nr:hypothetical protein [Pedobacter yulinensis]PST84991.1 hypothetical protein C7T94_02415 [Pedobacter yulinensis]